MRGVLATVLSLALCTCSRGNVTFRVNTTVQQHAAWPHYWEECVGSGHAALGLRPDWRAHLALCHDRLGFRRIRQHGLLDDDMGPVVAKGAHGSFEFNFTAVDSVYDYLVSIGVSPLVELSWMPAAIAANPSEKVWCYKGGHSKPTSPQDWHDVITALGEHLVARYGVDTVRTWGFEVWNEPNCAPCQTSSKSTPPDKYFPACIPGVSVRNLDYPKCSKSGGGWTLDTYLAVFNATSSALKSIDASIAVGGPSTEQLGWVDELRDYCKENGVGLDFISTHQYPSDPQVPRNLNGHSDTIREAVVAASPHPLYITEYSVGDHDDPSAAAGILTYIPRLQGPDGPQIFSYWAFSDVFEENCLDPTPYHNEWGLVNWYGIPKPSFRAFELLHEAGDHSLPVAAQSSSGEWGQDQSFASVMLEGSNDTAAVTAFAVMSSKPDGTANNVVFLTSYASDSFGVSSNVTVAVQICASNAATRVPLKARLRRIDATHANPKQVWVDAGSPKIPNTTLLSELQKASELVDEEVALVPGTGGCASAVVVLPSAAASVAVIDFNTTSV